MITIINTSNDNTKQEEKKVNPAWIAAEKYQGSFIYIAPEFRL